MLCLDFSLALSSAITPAAAAHRLSARPALVAALSVGFALLASDGGLVLSLKAQDVPTSAFITTISFLIYVLARVAGSRRRVWRREPVPAE